MSPSFILCCSHFSSGFTLCYNCLQFSHFHLALVLLLSFYIMHLYHFNNYRMLILCYSCDHSCLSETVCLNGSSGNSLEETLMLGKIEGRRRWGRQRVRWLDGITDSVDMNLSTLQEIAEDREAWHAAVHEVSKT